MYQGFKAMNIVVNLDEFIEFCKLIGIKIMEVLVLSFLQTK